MHDLWVDLTDMQRRKVHSMNGPFNSTSESQTGKNKTDQIKRMRNCKITTNNKRVISYISFFFFCFFPPPLDGCAWLKLKLFLFHNVEIIFSVIIFFNFLSCLNMIYKHIVNLSPYLKCIKKK